MLKVVAFILSMVVCAACHCQEYSAELLEQEADNLEALEELRNDVGEHHPDYAVTLAALGRIYEDMRVYSKAEAFFLQALALKKELLGDEHPHYANLLRAIGSLYFQMDNYYEAELYYLEEQNVRKKTTDIYHPDYVLTLCHLGLALTRTYRYERALTHYLEALNIQDSILGEECITNSDYANTLNGIGGVYTAKGEYYDDMEEYRNAEKYYLRALEVLKTKPNNFTDEYANILNNLGWIYTRLALFPKAEKYLLMALAIDEEIYGCEHPELSPPLINLGQLYFEMGEEKLSHHYFSRDEEIQAVWREY